MERVWWRTLFLLCCVNFGNGASRRGGWKPLNVAVARAPDEHLPDGIMRSLDAAVQNIHRLIFVRDTASGFVTRKEAITCSRNKGFHTEFVNVETFVRGYRSRKYKIDERGLDLTRLDANFVLFLNTKSVDCEEDRFMLAGAAPCMQPNVNLSSRVARPMFARLLVCLQNPIWHSFTGSFDLFRHEIMHALGFGTIVPDGYGQEATARTRDWRAVPSGPATSFMAFYMDFSDIATESAKKYFLCDKLEGVEAEDERKIHLNEYIYGNELMTPVLSNAENYFTYISASILEGTHFGNVSWYRYNRTAVRIESQLYWYGRSWGCEFALGSCLDFILHADVKRRGSVFPFCARDDVGRSVFAHEPHKVCFSNGRQRAAFEVTCNVMKFVRDTNGTFTPTSLQEIYPGLLAAGHELYGSGPNHRFCPMVKEFLDDSIRALPPRAEVVPCRD